MNAELLLSKDGPVKKFYILKEYGSLLRRSMSNDELKKLGSAELATLVTRMIETEQPR